MNKTKQGLILACLATGRYMVREGQLYGRDGAVLRGNTLKTGYTQHNLYNGKRGEDGIHVIAYLHVIVYLSVYGEYEDGYEIDHIDRNVGNNAAENLRAVTRMINKENRKMREAFAVTPIRGLEIANIRTLHGGGISQSEIARRLGLERTSVRNIIKKIEVGSVLKYEKWFKAGDPVIRG